MRATPANALGCRLRQARCSACPTYRWEITSFCTAWTDLFSVFHCFIIDPRIEGRPAISSAVLPLWPLLDTVSTGPGSPLSGALGSFPAKSGAQGPHGPMSFLSSGPTSRACARPGASTDECAFLSVYTAAKPHTFLFKRSGFGFPALAGVVPDAASQKGQIMRSLLHFLYLRRKRNSTMLYFHLVLVP